MKCNICDRALNEPKFNPEIRNYDPCDTCMTVIEDTLAGFIDGPAAEEDAFGADPVLEGLYPASYSPFDDE